jgi:enamine deaminase RidA (YjgF/YER057c/UK114 family)
MGKFLWAESRLAASTGAFVLRNHFLLTFFMAVCHIRVMRTTITKCVFPAALVCITLMASAAFVRQPQQPKKSTPMSESSSFRLFNPDTMAKPVAGYSQVAEITGGKVVYIAGQVALDASGNLVGQDNFRAQVEQVFKNLNEAVQAAGGTFHDVVKLNYYCAENVAPSAIPQVREIRDKYVNTQNPPTSTFVVVHRLVRPEWLIEVEAVAVVKR